MKNTVHLLTTFYLLFDTDLSLEEFTEKFSHDNIINSKVAVTLPDGSTYNASFADLVESNVVEFEENKNATDGEISDKVTA